MAADDGDAEDLEQEIDEHAELGSAKRVKRKPSTTLQLLVADFKRRAKGLTGPEIDGEIDALVERMIESHATAIPAVLRDEYQARMRAMVLDDPYVKRLVAGLRGAAARER